MYSIRMKSKTFWLCVALATFLNGCQSDTSNINYVVVARSKSNSKLHDVCMRFGEDKIVHGFLSPFTQKEHGNITSKIPETVYVMWSTPDETQYHQEVTVASRVPSGFQINNNNSIIFEITNNNKVNLLFEVYEGSLAGKVLQPKE